jgi:hypothetical protein
VCVRVCVCRHWAALFGLVETGKLLVNAKADLNIMTKSGETPLHLCAEKGNAHTLTRTRMPVTPIAVDGADDRCDRCRSLRVQAKSIS